MPKTQPLLSLCMIVKNEAAYLPRCLESVRNVVDEMIIVDTGSTDTTVDIATAYGAKVFYHIWQDDFALARNTALAQAAGVWILALDADEALEEQTQAQLRSVIGQTQADGLRMRIRNFTSPGELQAYEDMYYTRLFRNKPQFRYEQAIHEQIRTSIERYNGQIQATELTILHYGYVQPMTQGGDSRAKRNLAALEQAVTNSANDPYLYYQLGVTYKSLGQQQLAYAALQKALELKESGLDLTTLDKLNMKLAQLALAQDNFIQAKQYAQQSLLHNPDNLTSLYVIALANMFTGNIQQAYPYFVRIRRAPNISPAQVSDLDQVLNYCRSTLGNTSTQTL